MENSVQQTTENEIAVKLEKLFQAARNAKDTLDAKTAIKHYEEISAIEPNSWEALFYLAILKTNNITNGEISNASISVMNCLPKVFELIKTTIDDGEKQKDAVKEVVDQCSETTAWLIKASGNYYNSVTENDISFDLITAAVRMDTKRKARYESAQRMSNIGNIICTCGNYIEFTFGLDDAFYRNLAVDCWMSMLLVHFEHIKLYKVAVYSEESVKKFAEKVKQYNPSYEVPNIKPTEKRNYTIVAILIALGVFAISALWCYWIWFL